MKIERAKVAKFTNQLFDIQTRLAGMASCEKLSTIHRYLLNNLIVKGALYLQLLTAILSNSLMINDSSSAKYIYLEQEILGQLANHLSEIGSLEEMGLSVELH